MKFLVFYEESREEMESEISEFNEDFVEEVLRCVNLTSDELVTIQKFDTEWNDWVNMKSGEQILTRLKLKCVVNQSDRSSASLEKGVHVRCSEKQVPVNGSASPSHHVGEFVPDWVRIESSFSHALKGLLSKSLPLDWSAKHSLLTSLTDDLYKINKFPPDSLKQRYARELVSRYPHLKERLGSGHDAWVVKLNNKLKLMRSHDQSLSTRKRRSKLEVEADLKSPRKGVNWAPGKPPDMDKDMIQKQQTIMCREMTKEKRQRDSKKVKELMESTYGDRRCVINEKPPISEIVDIYPALFTEEGQYDDFRMLMEMDLDKTFLERFPPIAKELIKLAKTKKMVPIKEEILQLLESHRPSVSTAEMTAAILLTPLLLKEDPTSLYTWLEQDEQPNFENLPHNAPHLVFVGNPFTTTQFCIVAEKQLLLEPVEMTQAFQMLFSLYYNLNLEYPSKVRAVFLFFQKFVLQIMDSAKIPTKVVSLASAVNI